MKKKVLGYFYSLRSENPKKILEMYHVHSGKLPVLPTTLKNAKKSFESDLKNKHVGPNSKPRFHKLVIEEM